MEAFLRRLELSDHLPALRELGVENARDFEEVEDQDLDDMNMSVNEKRRLASALKERAYEFGQRRSHCNH